MRRNISGTRWVSVENENATIRRPGPDRNVRIETQQSRHVSHAASIPQDVSREGVLHSQSHSPLAKAAIYDAEDLRHIPDPHTRLPSVRSWSSFYSDDGAVSPKTVTPSSKSQSYAPASPIRNKPKTRRDSPISAFEPIDLSSTVEARKDSDATVFPHFPYTIKKPEAVTKQTQGRQDPWNLADLYRNAKDIYNVGPKGEGQKVWSSYKRFRKVQQIHSEIQEIPLKQMPTPRRPSAPMLAAHPSSLSPPSQMNGASDEATTSFESQTLRKDSEVSRSSCEVRVRIGPDIQQFVDVTKPLPRIPQLRPAPRSRLDVESKALPPVPHVQSAPKSKSRQHVEHKSSKEVRMPAAIDFVSTAASGVQYPTQWRGARQRTEKGPSRTKNNKSSQWRKPSLAEIVPGYQTPITTHSKPSTDKAELYNETKAKISRPSPITALQDGRTANIAIECGGVGGPGQVQPPMSERQKGKQKASHDNTAGLAFPKHWREKLLSPTGLAGKSMKQMTRKRKDSDASFACQGIEEPSQAYLVRDPKPSSQFRPGEVIEEGDMLPEPLFSGVRSGKEGIRDTRFYQPYCEVLDEY